ncbi:MAG: hypothetical protein K6F46_04890 [Desulfovibrio sp.]|nr:hypothetical protein [Desulfovibrio sp.]
MSARHGVRIKNVYHMLSYAYAALRQGDCKQLADEDFGHIHDLFAAILARGLAGQIRRGLYREYLEQRAALPTLRGKLDMPATMAERCACRPRLGCEFDELTANALVNRICKTAALLLARHGQVSKDNRDALRRILDCLSCVEPLAAGGIPWRHLRLHRGNAAYSALLAVCRLLFDGRLLSTESGARRMAEFLDDQQMCRLYEKFLLAYFREEHAGLAAASERVDWNLDSAPDAALPAMVTDVTLHKAGRTLIIDAKYYGRSMASNLYGGHKLHSANLYQIYAYVKNRDRDKNGTVAGLLLYAGTDETVRPDSEYIMDGNVISARTLDLNREFTEIRSQLDGIAHSLDSPFVSNRFS